jgi:hypothetical protein
MNDGRIVSEPSRGVWTALAAQCVRVTVSGTLCALLAEQPLIAEAQMSTAALAPQKAVQIQGQERVLHALNRLTFGPTPGQIAAVQKMGLEQWFERQLNPGSIDDSALTARLAQFPTANLSTADLERDFPGAQSMKAFTDGRTPMPSDPSERAMVERLIRLPVNPETPQGKPPAPSDSANGNMAGSGQKRSAPPEMAMDGNSSGAAQPGPDKPMAAAEKGAAPAKGMSARASSPEDRAAARELTSKLAALPPDERFQAIMALSPGDFDRVGFSKRGPGGPGQGSGKVVPGASRPESGDGEILLAGFSPQQIDMLKFIQGEQVLVASEAKASRLMRDIYSDRQLEAVMTDFWLNHFNVYVRKSHHEAYLLSSYERETILPHALGKFEDLLVATAQSAAMLEYLDNFRSVGPDSPQALRVKRGGATNPNGPIMQQSISGLNENYGRELMELHTLGVDGGYTQSDVTNIAKVFTGWGLQPPQCGSGFAFDESTHEPGEKTVLGVTVGTSAVATNAASRNAPGGRPDASAGQPGMGSRRGGQPMCKGAGQGVVPEGEKEGLAVLHMLATNPATAHFLSSKLAVRFVSDNPDPALVNRMAESFLKSGGDIKTVLRTMFHSPEFWSTQVYRAKLKTPRSSWCRRCVRAGHRPAMGSLWCRPSTSLACRSTRWGRPTAIVGRRTPGLAMGRW